MLRRLPALVAALSLVLGAAYARAEDIGYDPTANPFDALHAAVATADAQHKLVLLVAGGDWCVWCHRLHDYLAANADLDAALHEVFVVAQVYVGDDNPNKTFFRTLPRAAGAPHFWVLSGEGEVLKSQDTSKLEDGRDSYDRAALERFITEWRAHPK